MLLPWGVESISGMSCEMVVQKGEIKFYVGVPALLQTTLEQQLLAAYPDANIEVCEDYNIFSPNGLPKV